MRTYDATHDQWLIDSNITMPQGTEHDSDVFDWLCEGPFRQIAFPDMHCGNPVAHGVSTDTVGLARLEYRRAVERIDRATDREIDAAVAKFAEREREVTR